MSNDVCTFVLGIGIEHKPMTWQRNREVLLKAYFQVFIKTLHQKKKTQKKTTKKKAPSSLSLSRNILLGKQLSEREAIIFSVYRPLTFLMQSL